MATAFSENEKEMIRKKLNEVGKDCLLTYGVKKTTVDQLVQLAGISKGSFYNFYPSKEILFFTVLEEYQKELMDEVICKLEQEKHIGIDVFTELIYELYQNVRYSFIMTIVRNKEFDYLLRKIPRELIKDHHSLDDIFTDKILSYLRIKKGINNDLIAASLRTIFISMIHIVEIGESDFDQVLRLLIKGLAQQIIEEDQ